MSKQRSISKIQAYMTTEPHTIRADHTMAYAHAFVGVFTSVDACRAFADMLHTHLT